MKWSSALIGSVLGVILVLLNQPPTTPPEGNAWFDTHVTQSSRPVLLKFGADWCGPCRRLDEQLDQYSSQRVKVLRIDVDQNRELADYYDIDSIPRVYLLKQGNVIASCQGFSDVTDIDQWLDKHL